MFRIIVTFSLRLWYPVLLLPGRIIIKCIIYNYSGGHFVQVPTLNAEGGETWQKRGAHILGVVE